MHVKQICRLKAKKPERRLGDDVTQMFTKLVTTELKKSQNESGQFNFFEFNKLTAFEKLLRNSSSTATNQWA